MSPASNEWTDLATVAGFERCVRGSLRELYGYVGLLVGRDRAEAERQVTEVYRSLFRVSQAGRIDAVSLGSLRSAARELWLDRARIAILAQASEAGSFERVVALADLSEVERAVVVFRHVNRMPLERAADELGLDLARTRAIESRAITRLRGVDDASGRWIRGSYGDVVVPAPGLVDRIIDGLGEAIATRPVAGQAEHAPVDRDEPVDVDDAVESGDLGVTSGSLRPDPVRYRRNRWPLALSAVLLLALIGTLLLWLGRDRDDDTATPATTQAPPATTPPATVAASTTPATTAPASLAPATTVPGPGRFEPACAPRATIGEPADVDESALDEFGPLGSAPNLTVTLPQWIEGDVNVSTARVLRVPESMLVTVSPLSGAASQTLVARVGFDGTVFWVQCFDRFVDVVPIPEGDGSQVATHTNDGWVALSLADGALGDPLDPALAEQIEASFAAPTPEPEGAYIAFAEDDQVVAGYSADGTRLWSDPNAHPLPGEGFRTATTDGIGVAAICPDPATDPACTGGELRGYVPSTGVVRWKLEGTRLVAAVAEGFALVSDPDAGWVLIDVTSGEPIEGQTWANSDAFEYRCCGEGDFWYVDRQGGVLVVSKPGSLAIWYPAVAEWGTAEVTLP